MKKVRRFAAAVLSAALLPLLPPGTGLSAGWTAAAETADSGSLEDLQRQLDQLQVKEADLRREADAARAGLSEKEDYKESLDGQIENVVEQIALLGRQADAMDREIGKKETAIAEHETAIQEKEAANAGRFRELQQRLRAISKSGNFSMLQMLLDTESFTDYLIKSKMMKTVADNDQRLMDELETEIQAIHTEKEKLNGEKNELQKQKDELTAVQKRSHDKKKELDELSREAAVLIGELEKDVDYYTASLEETRRQEAAMDQLIEDLLNNIPPATTTTAPPTTTTTTAATTTTTTTTTASEPTTPPGSSVPTSPPTQKPTTTTTTTATAAPTNPDGTIPTTPGGLYDSGTMYWPVPTVKYLSDTFGGSRNHKGIDIANSPTTPVYGENIVAARDGVVIYANYIRNPDLPEYKQGGGYGFYCIVDHGLDSSGKRIITLYAHASVMYARVGDVVKGGQTVLAQAGKTGNVTGPHLHFEVRENNVCVDPFKNGYLIRK